MPDDLVLAQRAALADASVSVRYFARVRSLAQQQKVDGSVVTEADLAVEEEVRRVLLAERPEDAFLGRKPEAMGRAGVDGYPTASTGRWCSSREMIAGSP
ncbi:inositol monophosphatase family protein [Streptomyces sp. NPDC087894]|uniref:inositol monophosphatase family protein n=1 Tax=Streptomyces sp. NPDC087894 TaxID=3365816 RepID=UPI0037F987B1